MNRPTAAQVRRALEKWVPADRLEFWPGWDRRGRPWSGGIRGVIQHHIAGVGDGAVKWCDGKSSGFAYPFCNVVIRRDGTVIVMSVLSAWGSGRGGPWPRAGIARDQAHLYTWQIEFESWGRKEDFTPQMIDSGARVNCAIRDVAGAKAFPNFRRLIRHADWTDGGVPLGLTYWLPTRGRKNDTIRPAVEFRKEARRRWKRGPR